MIEITDRKIIKFLEEECADIRRALLILDDLHQYDRFIRIGNESKADALPFHGDDDHEFLRKQIALARRITKNEAGKSNDPDYDDSGPRTGR